MAKKERINTHQPIGGIIKQLRENAKDSKTELAEQVGVSKNHIGEIESGACYPSYTTLKKILFVYDSELTIRKIPKFPRSGDVKVIGVEAKETLVADAPTSEDCETENSEKKESPTTE